MVGFDRYDRRARLYPGMLAMLPVLFFFLILKPDAASGGISRSAISLLVFAGGFYFLANIARSAGKKIEPKLLERWGGWPSTVVLRHADQTIDKYTTARYHAALASIVPDLRLPSLEQERQNPAAADAAYRSATKKLLELRRRPQDRLLQDDNIEYGFRRNMLGLRPWGCTLSLLTISFILVILWRPLPAHGVSSSWILDDVGRRWQWYLLLLADSAASCGWLLYVRESWVRQAGFGYAERLFRSLDEPQSSDQPRSRRRGAGGPKRPATDGVSEEQASNPPARPTKRPNSKGEASPVRDV